MGENTKIYHKMNERNNVSIIYRYSFKCCWPWFVLHYGDVIGECQGIKAHIAKPSPPSFGWTQVLHHTDVRRWPPHAEGCGTYIEKCPVRWPLAY